MRRGHFWAVVSSRAKGMPKLGHSWHFYFISPYNSYLLGCVWVVFCHLNAEFWVIERLNSLEPSRNFIYLSWKISLTIPGRINTFISSIVLFKHWRGTGYSVLSFPFTAAAAAKLLPSCPTLCDLIDGSPPGSPVPGILQARTLQWVAISFSNAWKWKVKVNSLSRIWLPATPWTAAHQAPPSMGFSRQEY